MKNEFEQIFDSIAASTVPAQEDYTDSETGLLHCGKCHTPIQCRVTLFDKEKLMPCTCRCRQEQIAAEEQARKEQQRLDRIRRLKANGLQDRALLAYTFDKADNGNPAMKYAHRYVKHWADVKAEGARLAVLGRRWHRQNLCCRLYRQRPYRARHTHPYDELFKNPQQLIGNVLRGQEQIPCQFWRV